MKIKSWQIISIGILFFFGFVLGFLVYNGAFTNNVNNNKKSYDLFIHKGASLEDVLDSINSNNILIHRNNIRMICQIMGFNNKTIKEGHFMIKNGMSNYQIISKLRSGAQDPIKITLNNVRDMTELCGQISHYLILDSMSLLNKLTDSTYLSQIGYTKENVLSLFIPDTYEMYWNISFDKFIQRIMIENKSFWKNHERLQKAQSLHLSPQEIYTLASIVEKESNYEPERPTIAGVYLNRLKTNMKLQADPTVVFALGVSGLQRVLLEHLCCKSPFNTYLIDGLPPGPIYMPSINSIDAVLNAEQHDFIFFCAKEGYEGRHSFASSLQQHYLNAKNYQSWLNKQHIR
ncbi:MAG: endolytic transglycosylase MltG [Saprospiraceae bacterium]